MLPSELTSIILSYSDPEDRESILDVFPISEDMLLDQIRDLEPTFNLELTLLAIKHYLEIRKRILSTIAYKLILLLRSDKDISIDENASIIFEENGLIPFEIKGNYMNEREELEDILGEENCYVNSVYVEAWIDITAEQFKLDIKNAIQVLHEKIIKT